MFMIRRSAFEKIGGFRELRGAGHEDWEFYVRLTLAGYKVDVLPELLQFYRQVEGSLARTLPSEASVRRLIDAYEDTLSGLGLKGAALALVGLYRSGKEAEQKAQNLASRTLPPGRRFAFFSRASGRFETDPGAIERLRNFYRDRVSLEARLKFHKIFLAPFMGPYKPPAPE
jgi:GT2 family glycosyltransferase